MANQEHVDRLMQGVDGWNRWRKEHPDIRPTLINADLSGADLINDDLNDADLSDADLSGANLSYAHLRGAILSGANLIGANLSGTNLIGADLSGADLSGANLINADLNDADLSDADLNGTNLNDADLNGTDFTQASIGWTNFTALDLSNVKGLKTVDHDGPSSIGIDTIYASQGQIPESFLRGAGVPETFIEYMRSLVIKPIDYYTCFISYSSKDQDFAERLYADLQSKGVRCWFAPEDMKTGDKIRYRIDESIRMYDKLLLVLSKNSVASQWVEHEVETAIGKELEGKPNVLFPIRLDNAIMDCKTGWASHIRLTRHIGDFREWKQHDSYQKAFSRLLRDLQQT